MKRARKKILSAYRYLGRAFHERAKQGTIVEDKKSNFEKSVNQLNQVLSEQDCDPDCFKETQGEIKTIRKEMNLLPLPKNGL